MLKQKKKYSRPQRPFDKSRIEEENVLRDKYGLKNKREIWKADAAIGRVRNLAKELITANDEEKTAFIERLKFKGFKVENIAEVLSLDKEDWLKRRLQTILVSKGLTSTPKQARQLISHKHVLIGDKIVNIPSYMVALEEEPLIKLKIVLKTPKPGEKSKKHEVKDEETNDGKVVETTSEEKVEIESSENDAVKDSEEEKE